MKKLSIVITVPILTMAAIIAVAFFVKTKQDTLNSFNTKQLPSSYTNTVGKPTSGYPSEGSVSAPGNTVSSLYSYLQTTEDDGGTSDLQQLQKDSVGL